MITAQKSVVTLTDSDFTASVSQGITLVDFWAPWCGPCRMQGPIVEELAKNAPLGVKVAKLDVDDNPSSAASYGIMSIPTILIFKDGKPVRQYVGVQSAAALRSALESV